MDFLLFLLKIIAVSLSGVMAPGPVTATVINMGARSRYAGTLMAVGHAIVEFPLMVLIMFGTANLIRMPFTKIIIGLAGGAFLLIMAVRMFRSLDTAADICQDRNAHRPLLAGIFLSAGNPYFLVWWATVGLALASSAAKFGIWAFAAFAVTHWLCDLVWLQILSWASFKGSKAFGPRFQHLVTFGCALTMLGFGLYFFAAAIASSFR